MLNEPIRYEAIRDDDVDGQSATHHPSTSLAGGDPHTLSFFYHLPVVLGSLATCCCGCCVWASGLALIVACNDGAVATNRTSPTHLCLWNKSPYNYTKLCRCFDHSKRWEYLGMFSSFRSFVNVYFFERASFLELWFSCCCYW